MKLVYFTNVFDETSKIQRQADRMSMAASNKILSFFDAMFNHSDVIDNDSLHIISLGITNVHKGIKIFKPYSTKDLGYTLHMGIFVRIRIIRDIFSLFWGLIKTVKLVKKGDIVVFYGWIPQYVISLFICRILRAKCVLDIEDGPPERISSLSTFIQRNLFHIYSYLCKDGTLGASKGLLMHSRTKNQIVFHSVSKIHQSKKNYFGVTCRIYFGGSLMKDTGLELLTETIEMINCDREKAKELEFVITGYLSKHNIYRKRIENFTNVTILGNLSFDQFNKELGNCIIGLSLKLPGTRFGNTTFPSKVVDITSKGMLLITTDISDIRNIYGNSAIYLNYVNTKELAETLISVSQDRERLERMAIASKKISDELFSPKNTAHNWDKFISYL
jgi:glycosyltransferase involved in cell wall biosynthesis